MAVGGALVRAEEGLEAPQQAPVTPPPEADSSPKSGGSSTPPGKTVDGRSTVDIKTGELLWEPEKVKPSS